MPFDQVESYLTPTEQFYIRSHFRVPKLDVASYRLTIDGAARKPFALSYKELREMPSETRVATLDGHARHPTCGAPRGRYGRGDPIACTARLA
jgi:hypothetical protein